MKRTLLIDGDIIAYASSARSETKVDWDSDGQVSRYGNEDRAHAETVKILTRLQETLDADDVIVCLSDPSRRYFRHDVYPAYKSHRTHGVPPTDLDAVKRMLRDGVSGFKTKGVEGLEADDVLGIYATHPSLIDGEKIICTCDKDLRQIPGRLYNLRTEKMEEIKEGEGDRWFWMQSLTGDPTDGFPGCPKIGPVKANVIINNALIDWTKNGPTDAGPEPTVWKHIAGAYEQRGFDESYALSQAQVARICRHTDYDFTNKKAIPWTP